MNLQTQDIGGSGASVRMKILPVPGTKEAGPARCVTGHSDCISEFWFGVLLNCQSDSEQINLPLRASVYISINEAFKPDSWLPNWPWLKVTWNTPKTENSRHYLQRF